MIANIFKKKSIIIFLKNNNNLTNDLCEYLEQIIINDW